MFSSFAPVHLRTEGESADERLSEILVLDLLLLVSNLQIVATPLSISNPKVSCPVIDPA